MADIILCKISDIAPGSVIRVEHGELGLAVYNIDGTFYATADRCTHGLSSLSEGSLMGDEIECAFDDVIWRLASRPRKSAARGASKRGGRALSWCGLRAARTRWRCGDCAGGGGGGKGRAPAREPRPDT